ncbi:hypothetical protein R3P38DRAFT_2800627 [Favolaschia claudopus]|uniref:Uncharacterized protein n=1 Tax=Favolaschia claudopus TaxID=2862362 RepID=A0AAV9ZYE9_9AGAR
MQHARVSAKLTPLGCEAGWRNSGWTRVRVRRDVSRRYRVERGVRRMRWRCGDGADAIPGNGKKASAGCEINAVRVRSERGCGEVGKVKRKGDMGRRRRDFWKDKARYSEIHAVGVRSRGIRVRRSVGLRGRVRKSTEEENAVETGLEGEVATRCAGDVTSERWARVKKMRRRWAYVVKSVGNVVNDVARRGVTVAAIGQICRFEARGWHSVECVEERWCKTTKKYSEKEKYTSSMRSQRDLERSITIFGVSARTEKVKDLPNASTF